MASITQAQAALLNESFLDQLAKNQQFTADLSNLPLTERLLIEAAAVFVQNARKNLDTPDRNGRAKISTGNLQDSIKAYPIRYSGNSIELDLGYDPTNPGSKYADFVNEGVRGIQSPSKAPKSPYSFKANKGLRPGPSMRRALEEWLKNNRQVITAQKPVNFRRSRGGIQQGSTAIQRKRKALTEAEKVKGIAYAIGTNIRKKGLSRSGFFDKAVEQTFNDSFFRAVADVVGADVSIGIRRLNSLSNQ